MGGNRQSTARPRGCAVIGGGVVGLAVALHLLESGVDVTVFERTGVAAGASGVQPGGIRQQWGTRVNCLMAQESVGFYAEFPQRYGTVAQAKLDRCGYVFVAHEAASMRQLESNIAVQHELGIRSKLLSTQEAGELVPSLSPQGLAGAAYCADDGYYDRPQAVVEAFAELVVRLGGRLEIRGVATVERDGEGWQLGFEDGVSQHADTVVVATAHESVPLLAQLGHRLPIKRESRYLFYSDPIRERLLEPLVIAVDLGFAAKQLANGRVLASDLHAAGALEDNEARWRRRIREVGVGLLPILEYVSFPIVVAGDYDMTPDGQPIVDQVEEGLWVAAGFSGHGFMVAPAVGRMIAKTFEGSPLPEWSNAVRVDRFASSLETVEAQVI